MDNGVSNDSMFDPRDKVAVVTGGAGGIGLGMARAFTDAGMSVVIADIDADRVETAADTLRSDGHDATGVRTDVANLDEVRELATAAMDTHGRVDVLCNNAGSGGFAKLSKVTIDDWEWTLGVDLWGPIHGVNVFQPLIERSPHGGHINTTSSVSGLIAGAAAGPYNVAKHGVIALMATLEREFRIAKSNHRASVLCPGPINTDISRNSVRHRREAEGETAGPSTAGKKLGGKMNEFLSNGMDPDEVGRIVLDGIVHGRFWMFTHPKLLGLLDRQIEAMELDGSLSRGQLA
ncbi:MAG: SDR family NAD(P)-dependent oxidoreductase [Acidimicrobiia bacterium]|nr:SDR family NAD(P)-dependent oxidoreductase [Acidimicrobiia bacterium]